MQTTTKLTAASLLLFGFSACSGDFEGGEFEGAEDEAIASPGAQRGTAPPSIQASPLAVARAVRVNMAPTGMRISGDAELLANVVYDDGSEVAFLRIGGGYLLSEFGQGTSPRLRRLTKDGSLSEYFRELAPNIAIPATLEAANTKHGWSHLRDSKSGLNQIDAQEAREPREPEREIELGPESIEAPASGGLQDFNTCDTTTFVNQGCDFGDDHDITWLRTNRTANGNKNMSNVFQGETRVCAKDGPITVKVSVSEFFSIERDLSTGQSDHRLWTTQECERSCFLWDCGPWFCFADGRTIKNEVSRVDSALNDKYHFCGFYEQPGE